MTEEKIWELATVNSYCLFKVGDIVERRNFPDGMYKIVNIGPHFERETKIVELVCINSTSIDLIGNSSRHRIKEFMDTFVDVKIRRIYNLKTDY